MYLAPFWFRLMLFMAQACAMGSLISVPDSLRPIVFIFSVLFGLPASAVLAAMSSRRHIGLLCLGMVAGLAFGWIALAAGGEFRLAVIICIGVDVVVIAVLRKWRGDPVTPACYWCGYCLVGLYGEVCPECGRRVYSFRPVRF